MTKEIRFLTFSNEEVTTALGEFRRSQAKPFPGNTIERLAIQQVQETFMVMVQARDSRSGKTTPVQVGCHEVLAALIFFCKRRGIPLAMKANKTLEVIGDQITMLMTANFSYNRPEERNGTIVYTDDDLEVNKYNLQTK